MHTTRRINKWYTDTADKTDIHRKKNWPERYEVVVGWDPGLQTYFAQVVDAESEEDETVVWIGTVDIIGSVEELEKLLNENMPTGTEYAELPEDVVDQLESDRKEGI